MISISIHSTHGRRVAAAKIIPAQLANAWEVVCMLVCLRTFFHTLRASIGSLGWVQDLGSRLQLQHCMRAIQDNVTFGLAFDEAKYQRAVDACALTDDIAMLPAGSATELGERGINLSGAAVYTCGLKRSHLLSRAAPCPAEVTHHNSSFLSRSLTMTQPFYRSHLCYVVFHNCFFLHENARASIVIFCVNSVLPAEWQWRYG